MREYFKFKISPDDEGLTEEESNIIFIAVKIDNYYVVLWNKEDENTFLPYSSINYSIDDVKTLIDTGSWIVCDTNRRL